eukprot:m.66928 g.66928  ORF g.66928 m.66928 type:complete len:299 (-) comp9840_c0_seq1:2108-3004(-)
MSMSEKFTHLQQAFEEDYAAAERTRDRLRSYLSGLLAEEDRDAAAEIQAYVDGESTRWEPTAARRRSGAAADADRSERESQRLRIRLAEAEDELAGLRGEVAGAEDTIEDFRRQLQVIRDVVLNSESGTSPRKQDSLRKSLAYFDELGNQSARLATPRAGKRASPRKSPAIREASSRARTRARLLADEASRSPRSPAWNAECVHCGTPATLVNRVVVDGKVIHKKCLQQTVGRATYQTHRFHSSAASNDGALCRQCTGRIRPYAACVKCSRCSMMVHRTCQAAVTNSCTRRSSGGLRN